MKVILELPEKSLEKLGELAKFQKRSRKAFMEYVLINHSESAKNEFPKTIAATTLQESKNNNDYYIPKPKLKRSFENYQQLRIDCASNEEWQELKQEILSSDLSQKQKALLTT